MLKSCQSPSMLFNSHTASSRPGSASSRPQSATSRGSTVTPRSEFVVQTVAKQDHNSASRPASARAAEIESSKISENEYVSVRLTPFHWFVFVVALNRTLQEDFDSDEVQ